MFSRVALFSLAVGSSEAAQEGQYLLMFGGGMIDVA